MNKVMFNEKPISIRRVIFYFLGLFIMALGIAFAVNSDFGVSPVTTLPYVASRILGVSIGNGTIVAFVVFIIIQIVIYRTHMKLTTYVLQFVMAFVFGYFTDFTKWLISPLGTPSFWPVQLVFCFVGIMLVGLGLRMYLTTDMVSIPSDGVPVALAWATKKPLHIMKRTFDCCCVAISLIASLAVLHDYKGLWIGTVLAALGVGTALKFWSNLFQKPLERFVFGGEQSEEVQKSGNTETVVS